jgi:hypothetical protein
MQRQNHTAPRLVANLYVPITREVGKETINQLLYFVKNTTHGEIVIIPVRGKDMKNSKVIKCFQHVGITKLPALLLCNKPSQLFNSVTLTDDTESVYSVAPYGVQSPGSDPAKVYLGCRDIHDFIKRTFLAPPPPKKPQLFDTLRNVDMDEMMSSRIQKYFNPKKGPKKTPKVAWDTSSDSGQY